MKNMRVKGILLAWLMLLGPEAFATFVPITVAPNGNAPTFSFIQVDASGRGNTTETLLSPIAAPYSGQANTAYRNPHDAPYVEMDVLYSLGNGAIEVNLPRLDRGGPSSGVVNGGWLFSTTDVVDTRISGNFDIYASDSTTSNFFRVILDDLTAGTRLLYSEQSAASSTEHFDLSNSLTDRNTGALTSLDNRLAPGHAYRLLYSIGQGTNEANASNSTARAQVTLTAVPEPGAVALLAAGLISMIAIWRRRFKRRETSDE